MTFHALYEGLLGSVAILLILNGIDDLVPAFLVLRDSVRRRRAVVQNSPAAAQPARKTERRIAIFVPCWQESDVIGDMVRHNVAAIRYRKYDFFLGVYPNDDQTVEVAKALAGQFKNVHIAMCPRPGPSSKADCLNSIYRGMLAFEKGKRARFDTVVVHDAEDLIHPQSLAVINKEREQFEMVQIPVLPLPTPPGDLTHGVYCEDFAEYQLIDMPARQLSRSFIPSNGVGTAYSRKALTDLAAANQGTLFQPECLTEDYETGLRVYRLGLSQTFYSLRVDGESYVATREYFPRRFSAAVRQRTRWIMGNALQSWERHGWNGTAPVRYWLWRDRKGLLTSPLGLLTNVLFLLGLATWSWSAIAHQPWLLEVRGRAVAICCLLTLVLQIFRLALRMHCVYRTFDLTCALLVPLRAFHGNLLNACASVSALRRYLKARRAGSGFAWLKTSHVYPDQLSRSRQHRQLDDVLVSAGMLTRAKAASLTARVPQGAQLADYAVHAGALSEPQLSEALGLQSGMASIYLDPSQLPLSVASVLPPAAVTGIPVIPFGVERGQLFVAGPRALEASELQVLRRFTKLDIAFHLVTWRNFEELQSTLA